MRELRKLLVAFAIITFGTSVFAAELTLDKVCAQLAAYPNTTGDFTQVKTINSAKGKRNLKSTGTFIFSLDGIMWKTEKPFPSTLAVGRTSVIQTAADGKQTVIDASDNQVFGSIANTLVAIFSSDVSELNAVFDTKFMDKGNGAWEVDLKPKDSTIASVLNTLTLTGISNGESTSLESMILTENAESTISYTFANQKYPKELTADEKANFKAK